MQRTDILVIYSKITQDVRNSIFGTLLSFEKMVSTMEHLLLANGSVPGVLRISVHGCKFYMKNSGIRIKDEIRQHDFVQKQGHE